jgi:hypothetical protein
MHDSTNDPMNESDDILAGSLGRLPREMMPPDSLEERTVATLRGAGLIQTRSRSGVTLATWVLAASIGAIAFVGGSVMSKQRQAAQPVYALTLSGGQIDDSAAQVNRAAEYEAWAISAHASSPSSRMPNSQQGGGATSGGSGDVSIGLALNSDTVIVDDLIPTATKGISKTYFITAPTKDSAVKIAKNCPHLKYGGRITLSKVNSGQP